MTAKATKKKSSLKKAEEPTPGIETAPIHTDTEEYKLGNSIYAALMFVSRVADAVNHYFYFIGSLSSDPQFTKRGRG